MENLAVEAMVHCSLGQPLVGLEAGHTGAAHLVRARSFLALHNPAGRIVETEQVAARRCSVMQVGRFRLPRQKATWHHSVNKKLNDRGSAVNTESKCEP
jgi:hypothetical protein